MDDVEKAIVEQQIRSVRMAVFKSLQAFENANQETIHAIKGLITNPAYESLNLEQLLGDDVKQLEMFGFMNHCTCEYFSNKITGE